MRKYAVAMALATTALATPTLAKDHAWYIGVDAGGQIVENTKFDLRDTGTTIANDAVRLHHKVGFDVDGNVGYDFGPFRAEFEIGYKDARADTATSAAILPASAMPVRRWTCRDTPASCRS